MGNNLMFCSVDFDCQEDGYYLEEFGFLLPERTLPLGTFVYLPDYKDVYLPSLVVSRYWVDDRQRLFCKLQPEGKEIGKDYSHPVEVDGFAGKELQIVLEAHGWMKIRDWTGLQCLPKYSETLPKLFTLRAMAAHLKVPQKWLREQVDAGKVPAVSTGSGYIFSLVPTIKGIERMIENQKTD